MVKIKQNLVSEDKYGIKCPYAMEPQYVVIHNTANDASAANEIAYMRRNNREVSFHYAVDDTEIVQGIPENRNAWHAGDGGSGKGNRYGIGVEICWSKSGGEKFTAAEKNAAEFAAYLLKKYGWGIDRLKKHQDFNGKYCPHRTLDLGWERFVDMVEAHLNETAGDDAAKRYTVGRTYHTQVDALAVRIGAGTGFARRSYSQLTANARQHAYPTGYLKKGTAVTCLAVGRVGDDIWMRIPSGWCAAYYDGQAYIA